MTESRHGFCPQCGKALLPDMAFCAGCGLKVGDTAAGTRSEGPGVGLRAAVGRTLGSSIVLAALLVAIGLIGYGFLTRPAAPAPQGGTPGIGGVPTVTPSPVAAPIVGLTILSPTDGQVVATKEVTVIGTAPPGLTITQDVSFGPDQHTTVDGTGHWAIKVGLKDGENRLTFRIGDDQSTKKTIRVDYTPPAS
jgi:hypothetical protein